MNIKLVRPFKICGIDCTLTLDVSATRHDLELEQLAIATASDAVMAFTHAVLASVPASKSYGDEALAGDLDKLRGAAEALTPGGRWTFRQLVTLCREKGLFAEIIGGDAPITRQQSAILSIYLRNHGGRVLRATGRERARRYVFRPWGGHEADHV